jgi:hypothetical protein
MLKVKQLNKFKKDLARYRREIDSIPNEDIKKKGYNLINKLIEEYNYIDAAHDPSTSKSLEPVRIRDNITRSIDLRIELDKLIKDLNASQ